MKVTTAGDRETVGGNLPAGCNQRVLRNGGAIC
jgi:hypothetical protein